MSSSTTYADARTIALVGFSAEETANLRQIVEPVGWRPERVAGTGRAELAAATGEAPHVWLVVSDGLPSTCDLVEEILRLQVDTAVVVLSGDENEDEMFAVLRAGGSGYLRRTHSYERLPAILSAVTAGEVALPRLRVAGLARAFRRRPGQQLSAADGRVVELTVREAQVVALLRSGCTTRAIARRMHVADVTVRTHVSTVCRKLRVANREELLALLVDP